MVASKKSQELLQNFKPAVESIDIQQDSNYIDITQWVTDGKTLKPKSVQTKLWFREKEVTDIINLVASTRYFSDSVIAMHGPQGCGKTDVLSGIITYLQPLFSDIIFIDDPDKFTLNAEKYNEFSSSIKTKLNNLRDKNERNKKDPQKILFVIDNYGSCLRHDPTDIDRTTHTPFDQLLLDFENITTLVCISDQHMPKFKNHIFKDKFITYEIPVLTTEQIKTILFSRIKDKVNLGENYFQIADKLIEMSFFVKKPSIKNYLKVLTLSRINFVESIEDTKKIKDSNTIILKAENVEMHNFYKSLTVFSDYSFKEIKASSEFEFSRENITKEIEKQMILSDFNKNYMVNVVARKSLKISNKKSAIATIMAVGPTGTGKTLAAHVLAKICYGDSERIVRINMNEMSSSHHVNKILGSAPGFVGYKEGTPLTKGLEAKYPCVVGNTIIKTTIGDLTAENIYERYLNGEKFDLHGIDPETGEKCIIKMHMMLKKEPKPLIKITTEKGTLTCTEDHKLLVKENDKYIWKKAIDISMDDDIVEV